jgi:small subunit ribosomal protein S5
MAEKEEKHEEKVEEKIVEKIVSEEKTAEPEVVKEVIKEVVQEVKQIQAVPVPEEVPRTKFDTALDKWVPKTRIGKDVFSGKITSIDDVLNLGLPIRESEIVDKLVPEIKNEIILIGGRTGKGGGIQRIPVKITAKMHRSGRRLASSSFAVVGNENGLVGVGKGNAIEARDAIGKAIQRAKMNIIRIKMGCGSWECKCGTKHSIPLKTIGKSGSVRVELLPAPKGVGLVAENEAKKILRLAGIKDVWVRTSGNTSARINLVSAIFDALKKLYIYPEGD